MNILCKPVGLFHINADNGYLIDISLQTAIYLVQKSVDMLLHVPADELIYADNHEQIYWGGGAIWG